MGELFHEYRNKTLIKVKEKKNMVQNFSDYQAFNQILNKQDETISLFFWAEENTPYITNSFYNFAKDDLFALGKFKILNKFINPAVDYSIAEQTYQSMIEFNDGQEDNFEESMFITEIQQLVTILKENNRTEEAKEIINKASLLIKDPLFRMAMESILTD